MGETRAVIFDLFGTLMYLEQETHPYQRLFVSLGLEPAEYPKARKIALTQDFDNLAEMVAILKPKASFDTALWDEVERERQSATLYPETTAILEQLQAGGIRLGLISNLASPYKLPFFDLGLKKYFEEVLFSCDVGLIKPDPRIYQLMLGKLCIEPAQALMVGDKFRNDVEGPRLVGMRAVHLDRKNSSPQSIPTLERISQYI